MRAGHGQVMAGSELTPAVCMDVLTPSIHLRLKQGFDHQPNRGHFSSGVDRCFNQLNLVWYHGADWGSAKLACGISGLQPTP